LPDLFAPDSGGRTSETPDTPPNPDPAVIVTFLPYLSRKPNLLSGAKRETSFDELQSTLQGDDCEKKMEVVGHDHELMQQIFGLGAVVEQNFEEELRHSVGLQQALLFKSASSNKVRAEACSAMIRRSHEALSG
jgi:hypothetical protein